MIDLDDTQAFREASMKNRRRRFSHTGDTGGRFKESGNSEIRSQPPRSGLDGDSAFGRTIQTVAAPTRSDFRRQPLSPIRFELSSGGRAGAPTLVS